ncbi:MAG: DUF2807 domain-containing protein [Chloroflexi bacterium]|nr:DUF2807 domain-containing protein [Chloroflexota bacterium]
MAILKKEFVDFDSLSFSHGFHAEIVRGAAYSIELDVADVYLDVLDVEQRGTAIHFGLNTSGKPGGTRSGHLRATITMPELRALAISGGGGATISGFESGDDFAVAISGGGHLTGDLKAGDLAADIGGGSRMRLTGSAEDIKLNVTGGAKVDLSDFIADNAMVNATGGSKVQLNIDGKLYANATGGSKISYQGGASVSGVHTSGGSMIRRATVKV